MSSLPILGLAPNSKKYFVLSSPRSTHINIQAHNKRRGKYRSACVVDFSSSLSGETQEYSEYRVLVASLKRDQPDLDFIPHGIIKAPGHLNPQ